MAKQDSSRSCEDAVVTLWKTIWQFTMKLITLLAPDLTIMFVGKSENLCPHESLCGNVYGSFILCCLELEAKAFFNGCMHKLGELNRMVVNDK